MKAVSVAMEDLDPIHFVRRSLYFLLGDLVDWPLDGRWILESAMAGPSATTTIDLWKD